MSDRNFEELKTMDYFFYNGQNPLDEEIKHDLILGLLQPRRSLFYDRNHGAGINEYENYPNSLILQINLRFNIASWISRRNGEVSAGEEDRPDRRVAVSQHTININGNQGNIDVAVNYISFADYNTPQTITVPAGIGAVR